MRRGYQLAKWRRRAETLNRKAGELLEEITNSEGDASEITGGAHSAYIGSEDLISALQAKK